MKNELIVTIQKNSDGVERRFRANSKTNFNKEDRVSRTGIRTLFQHYGTIEAVLRLIAASECEGYLQITVIDGLVKTEGNLVTYHSIAFNQVGKLVDELSFTAGCLANQFEAGTITVTISLSQTLEYMSS